MNDDRNIPIRKVGVKHLSYPIVVLDQANGTQQTVAEIEMYADLPHHFKGTHMSRFIDVFNRHSEDLSMPRFLDMLEEVREVLDARTTYADIRFPYFMDKKAPVSGQKSKMRYRCGYSGEVGKEKKEFYVTVSVPVTTVCPCSKAISERGAHNQRGIVSVQMQVHRFFWIEDVIKLIEDSASSDVYTLLKREDEKYVTERAYDNPRFVEDLVREITSRLEINFDFSWIKVEAENFESIHNHSAYACVERPRFDSSPRTNEKPPQTLEGSHPSDELYTTGTENP